jgi:hypothetical protein
MQWVCMDCGEHSVDIWRRRCPRCYYRYMRAVRRHKQHQCVHCRATFTTTRRDARYCSSACRLKAYRERREEVE